METQAKRFKLAREKYNDHGFQSRTDVISLGIVEKNKLYDLENPESKRTVGTDAIVKLADYYGVCIDWLLLGREPIKPNPTLKAAADYIGLNASAVDNIKRNCEKGSYIDTYEMASSKPYINDFFEKAEIDEFFERLVALDAQIEYAKKEMQRYEAEKTIVTDEVWDIPFYEYADKIDSRMLRLNETINSIVEASKTRNELIDLAEKIYAEEC